MMSREALKSKSNLQTDQMMRFLMTSRSRLKMKAMKMERQKIKLMGQ